MVEFLNPSNLNLFCKKIWYSYLFIIPLNRRRERGRSRCPQSVPRWETEIRCDKALGTNSALCRCLSSHLYLQLNTSLATVSFSFCHNSVHNIHPLRLTCLKAVYRHGEQNINKKYHFKKILISVNFRLEIEIKDLFNRLWPSALCAIKF